MAASVRSHLVFVYGTLKSGQPNYHEMLDTSKGHAKLVGKARTDQRWPLVIASKFNIPFLLRLEGIGHNILGEVYSIDDAKFAFLDVFESYPSFYGRYQTNLTMLDEENTKVAAWTYFLKEFKPKLRELPFIEDYDSYGDHGRRYVESETSVSFEDEEDEETA